jgi:hypothetical protein
MKKAMGFFLGSICVVVLLGLLVTPQPRVQHQGSSAFDVALEQAVNRLEGGSKFLLGGAATPVDAQLQPTFDGRYTCETYEAGLATCDPAACGDHTTDPVGHTCVAGEYTCQAATCDTYDRQQLTCDPYNSACPGPGTHTTEAAPFNHTCDGHTCDGAFTCDFTVDPREPTCDAADPNCHYTTFDAFQVTCDPMKEECRVNNPDHCTAEGYFTCAVPIQITCDPGDPACPTIDPAQGCATATEHTTWGQIKTLYLGE